METVPEIGDHVRIDFFPDNVYLMVEWLEEFPPQSTHPGKRHIAIAGSIFEVINDISNKKGPHSASYELSSMTKVGHTELPHYYIVDHRVIVPGESYLSGINKVVYSGNVASPYLKYPVVVGEFP